jgi:putative MATE family efflux protein
VDDPRLTDRSTDAEDNGFVRESTAGALAARPLPTWRLVLVLAAPTLLQQTLIFFVSLFDRLLAGRYQALDQAEQIASQAAQTTANYLAWCISSYSILVSVGATALVARFVGAGDRRGAIHATNQAVLLGILLGLLATLVGLAGVDVIVSALQLRGPAAGFTADYLKPMFALLVFQLIEQAGIASLVGAGDTRTGLWVLGGVALINVPLTALFFAGWGPVPRMGFTGIAVGTAIAHTLGGLAVLAVLVRGRAGLRLRLSLLKPNADLLRRLLRVSVPAGIDSLSVAGAQLWFLSIVNGLGDVAGSAHGLALVWEASGFLLGAAFGTAAMALVGQNLGAGRPNRAARSGWTAYAMGAAVMCTMGAIFFTLAPSMLGLFCPKPEQAPIVEAGVPVLRLVAFTMPALAASIILTAALRGAGDVRVPVLFTWFGFFAVRIPLAYLLTRARLDLGPWGSLPGPNLGLFGAWLAMFADVWLRGLLIAWRFAGGRWQGMRV